MARELYPSIRVATVLTACGIETVEMFYEGIFPSTVWLQQYLPLAVLKPEKLITPECRACCIRCNSTYRLRY